LASLLYIYTIYIKFLYYKKKKLKFYNEIIIFFSKYARNKSFISIETRIYKLRRRRKKSTIQFYYLKNYQLYHKAHDLYTHNFDYPHFYQVAAVDDLIIYLSITIYPVLFH
jgi:hypothetical protein